MFVFSYLLQTVLSRWVLRRQLDALHKLGTGQKKSVTEERDDDSMQLDDQVSSETSSSIVTKCVPVSLWRSLCGGCGRTMATTLVCCMRDPGKCSVFHHQLSLTIVEYSTEQ